MVLIDHDGGLVSRTDIHAAWAPVHARVTQSFQSATPDLR
ncbi:Hypothetical protein A7982_08947 [Minicystis rosea]|nr:Hypothetical protein A7982_08947 [Minicystis rosea]